MRECTITGELYISVICGKKDNKDFQISDTQNTIFTKKEFVNKNGEQISYNGYLGKEKPKKLCDLLRWRRDIYRLERK